jgi:hypothetical protein
VGELRPHAPPWVLLPRRWARRLASWHTRPVVAPDTPGASAVLSADDVEVSEHQ